MRIFIDIDPSELDAFRSALEGAIDNAESTRDACSDNGDDETAQAWHADMANLSRILQAFEAHDPKPISVRATVETDDGALRVTFDAGPWLDKASPREIASIVHDNFGSGETSDRIALESNDPRVRGLFDYLALRNESRRDDSVGFSVSIDEMDFRAW